MSEWGHLSETSRERWERNAANWDDTMGEASNDFHRLIILPDTERLLNLAPGQRVLDIACGNGNFSRRLAELGAKVTAFDYSETMVEKAKERSAAFVDTIDYRVADATDMASLMALGPELFDAAVANMALMDIADIHPLFAALRSLIKPGGTFVFSVMHPCFQAPAFRKVVEEEDVGHDVVFRSGVQIFRYIRPEAFEGIALLRQPVPHYYFHRPLSELLNTAFEHHFVLDGMAEPVFPQDENQRHRFQWAELPPALIIRVRNT